MQQPLSRAHPERTAWIVVWSAFVVFCVLLVAVPLTARYVLRYSTVVKPAKLEVVEGTARVTNPATGRLDAYTKDSDIEDVGEGIVIQLDDKSNAYLRFADGSLVHILPDSDLTVERLRAPRFASGVTPTTIRLRTSKGTLSVVTSKATRPAGLDFELRLQELGTFVALNDDGAYGVTADPTGGEFWTNMGSAVVTANGRSVRLLSLERTTLTPGAPPAPPFAGAKNLIANGDFGKGLQDWEAYNDQGFDGGTVDGTVTLASDGGSQGVRFFRSGSNRNHCETVIQQQIDKPLPDPVSSLVVRARLKVVSQSLSGGGDQASEYPLMIRIRFRDEYGSENEWVQGFYAGDPAGKPIMNGTQVPLNDWYYSETQNLLDTLKPRPARIVWVKVYASGWDYESVLGSISLEVQ